jgi:tetratricopeptide (TPR) repeat protein/tRNA A-37 threonylcarbamoyl transferase component Bud32
VSAPVPSLQIALGDRYVVEREFGRGAVATVYCARDQKHDRQVALKVLDPELSLSLAGERFLREIKVIARLQHPHILPLFDSGETEGLFYYVMPLIAGNSLRTRLTKQRILSIEDALRIASEVASALDYAHREGVIHRDIKPENILLQDGHAVVADFGITRAISTSATTSFTQTGIVVGTPAYMSPEQAVGDREIDGRSDVYALGCVLYEMLAGEPPFRGPTSQAVISRRFIEPPMPVRRVRDTVPESIERSLATALALEPADRFPSAEQFGRALRMEGPPVAPIVAAAPRCSASGNASAEAMYEDARRIIDRRDAVRLQKAVDLLSHVVRLDPSFASAHALLAVAHLLSADLEVPVVRACDEAKTAALAALHVSAAESDAHAALGFAHTLSWEWSDADRELRHAVELTPTSSLAHHWRAIYLCAVGQLDEARKALTRSIDTDEAATARYALGVASYYARDFDTAVRVLRRVVQEHPAAPSARVLLGSALAARGAVDDATREFERSVDIAGELQPFALAAMGCTLAASGRKSEASSLRDDLSAYARRMDISPFYGAVVSAALGDAPDALEALERAVEEHDSWMLALKVHPWLDSLRRERGFAALVAKVGL